VRYAETRPYSYDVQQLQVEAAQQPVQQESFECGGVAGSAQVACVEGNQVVVNVDVLFLSFGTYDTQGSS